MASTRQTTEQRRAAQAWEDVDQGVTDKDKYGTLARKMSSMIQINGLGTALAFLLAKGKNKAKDGHMEIFSHLSNWVLAELQLQGKYSTLMDLVRKEDMATYRRATTEAIEYAIWLKRYVEAKDWGSDQGDDS